MSLLAGTFLHGIFLHYICVLINYKKIKKKSGRLMQIKHLAKKEQQKKYMELLTQLNYGRQNSDTTEIPEGANFL